MVMKIIKTMMILIMIQINSSLL